MGGKSVEMGKGRKGKGRRMRQEWILGRLWEGHGWGLVEGWGGGGGGGGSQADTAAERGIWHGDMSQR